MGWTFYDSSGRKLNTAATSIDVLDIDGATDIGAAIVDADLFIIDDGAGGTNRKTAASRIKTYAGTTQAVQSDIEAETNQDTYVPPDLIKHSPGVAKFWVKWEQGGSHSSAVSYNSDSVTDGGAVGDTDHVITNDFSGTNYVIASGSDDNGSTGFSTNWTGGTMAAGTLTTITRQNSNGNAVDIDHANIILYGDQ